jgi:hypothetical protein
MSSISGISPTTCEAGPVSSGRTNLTQQRVADLVSIGTSLQNGDIASAQQAFASLMQITSFANPNGQLAQDVSALGSGLQSGDVSSAQQALSNLGNLLVGFIENRAGASGPNANQTALLTQLESIVGVSAPSAGAALSVGLSETPSTASGALNLVA